MRKRTFTAKRLCFDALLIAIYFALSFLTLETPVWKISVSGLSIMIGAILFGPLDGFLIGLLGAFLEQLVGYGLTVTTIIWIMPAAIRGLVTGLYAKSKGYELTKLQIVFICIVSGVLLTIVNTLALYLDSKIIGYHYTIVLFTLVGRIFTGMTSSILYAVLLPMLLKLIKKNVKM